MGMQTRGSTSEERKFVEILYQILHNTFSIHPTLSVTQFLHPKGYAERKILLVIEVIQCCIQKHQELMRVQKEESQKAEIHKKIAEAKRLERRGYGTMEREEEGQREGNISTRSNTSSVGNGVSRKPPVPRQPKATPLVSSSHSHPLPLPAMHFASSLSSTSSSSSSSPPIIPAVHYHASPVKRGWLAEHVKGSVNVAVMGFVPANTTETSVQIRAEQTSKLQERMRGAAMEEQKRRREEGERERERERREEELRKQRLDLTLQEYAEQNPSHIEVEREDREEEERQLGGEGETNDYVEEEGENEFEEPTIIFEGVQRAYNNNTSGITSVRSSPSSSPPRSSPPRPYQPLPSSFPPAPSSSFPPPSSSVVSSPPRPRSALAQLAALDAALENIAFRTRDAERRLEGGGNMSPVRGRGLSAHSSPALPHLLPTSSSSSLPSPFELQLLTALQSLSSKLEGVVGSVEKIEKKMGEIEKKGETVAAASAPVSAPAPSPPLSSLPSPPIPYIPLYSRYTSLTSTNTNHTFPSDTFVANKNLTHTSPPRTIRQNHNSSSNNNPTNNNDVYKKEETPEGGISHSSRYQNYREEEKVQTSRKVWESPERKQQQQQQQEKKSYDSPIRYPVSLPSSSTSPSRPPIATYIPSFSISNTSLLPAFSTTNILPETDAFIQSLAEKLRKTDELLNTARQQKE